VAIWFSLFLSFPFFKGSNREETLSLLPKSSVENPPSSVMPEIQTGIQIFSNTVDPGLKIAGVTNKGQ